MTRIHLSLRTPDMEASTAFYRRLLGVAPDKVRDGYVRFAPADVPIVLSLQPGDAALDHLGLRVEAHAASGAFAALDEAGLPNAPRADVVCCHAEKHETWLTDPDGRAWEVYAVTDDAPTASATVGACCP